MRILNSTGSNLEVFISFGQGSLPQSNPFRPNTEIAVNGVIDSSLSIKLSSSELDSDIVIKYYPSNYTIEKQNGFSLKLLHLDEFNEPYVQILKSLYS